MDVNAQRGVLPHFKCGSGDAGSNLTTVLTTSGLTFLSSHDS